MSNENGPATSASLRMRQIEQSEWWLSFTAIAITLLLTAGIASFAVPMLHHQWDENDNGRLRTAVQGLVGLVLLFDVYVIYQQLQIHRIRRRLVEREELFQLISENAVDMIAVVDGGGRRLYNGPSYQRILGYTAEELRDSSPLQQIHPDDLPLVLQAAKEARQSGLGRRIEYRMRRKRLETPRLCLSCITSDSTIISASIVRFVSKATGLNPADARTGGNGAVY